MRATRICLFAFAVIAAHGFNHSRAHALTRAFNGTDTCRSRADVVSIALSSAAGAYEEGVVCGHCGAYYCDCSGLVSEAWGLPPPAIVTQQMQTTYCAELGSPAQELQPGDAILNPQKHVEMFVKWLVPGQTYVRAACHDPAEGCSHGPATLSDYIGHGYIGCRPHAQYVCP